MRRRNNWLAIRGRARESVLAELGYVDTDQDDFRCHGFLSSATVGEWLILFAAEQVRVVDPHTAARLSVGGEAVGCDIDPLQFHSEAAGYRDGNRVWRVSHSAVRSVDNLDVEGQPPAEFRSVRDDLMREQAALDDERLDLVYEIPIALTGALCGFRPDEASMPAHLGFTVLIPQPSGPAAAAHEAQRHINRALADRVRAEIWPAAEALGFDSALKHPEFHRFHPLGASHVMVRRRGEWSDTLEFVWMYPAEGPFIQIEFFVRRGSEERFGQAGVASVPTPRPSLLARLMGRRGDPAQDLDHLFAETKTLLSDVDRHLKEGAGHRWIKPAVYYKDGQTA